MKDEKQQNEFCLRMSGKAFISKELEIGRNYKITADGTITTKTESDNHNGTHTIYFKFEPVLVEIQQEGKAAIKAKDIRRQSQKLRGLLYREWQEKEIGIEFEKYYEQRMNKILQAVIENLI